MEVEGTCEIMELYQLVPESSIDKSWPELDKNPSEEDIQYTKQARNVSKKSPDEDFKVLSHSSSNVKDRCFLHN